MYPYIYAYAYVYTHVLIRILHMRIILINTCGYLAVQEALLRVFNRHVYSELNRALIRNLDMCVTHYSPGTRTASLHTSCIL